MRALPRTDEGGTSGGKPAAKHDQAETIAKDENSLRREIEELREQVESLRGEKSRAEALSERYKALYDFAPSGHVMIDGQGKVIDANISASVLLGRCRSRIINHPFSLFVERKDLHRFLVHLSECRSGAPRVCTELGIRLPGGGTHPIQLVSFPLMEGQFSYYQTGLTSLAEFKRVEDSLRASKEGLRLALKCARAGTWEIDLACGTVSWSEQLDSLLGAKPVTEATAVSKFIERIHPDDQNRAVNLIRQILAGEAEEFSGEFRMITGATARWVALLGRVVRDSDDFHPRVTGIGMDITDRKEIDSVLRKAHEALEVRVKERTAELRRSNAELQRQIESRRRLEERLLEVADREQNRIAQDIHDALGQHLTGIRMFTSALRDSLVQKALPEAETAERIGSLLDDVRLELRRIVSGLHPVAPEPNGLMIGLEQLAASICEKCKLECRFECPQAFLVSDNVVATHLFRIAQEAICNAIRHGGAQHIVVQLRESKSQVYLDIRDDGCGIGRQRDNHPGLGLQIMKSRAEAIGGKISIHPAKPVGTLVRFSAAKTNFQL